MRKHRPPTVEKYTLWCAFLMGVVNHFHESSIKIILCSQFFHHFLLLITVFLGIMLLSLSIFQPITKVSAITK